MDLYEEVELGGEIVVGYRGVWVFDNAELFLMYSAIDVQTHLVGAGGGEGAGGDVVLGGLVTGELDGGRIVHVPDEAIDALGGGEGGVFGIRRAGDGNAALAVENFQGCGRGRTFEEVVEGDALLGVLAGIEEDTSGLAPGAGGLVVGGGGLEGDAVLLAHGGVSSCRCLAAGLFGAGHPEGVLGCEEVCSTGAFELGELAEEVEVVQNPKTATVAGDGHFVTLNGEVVDGDAGKVGRQGLPAIAVVSREVDGGLRCRRRGGRGVPGLPSGRG